MAQDLLEKTFLAELEALEQFRISYTGLHRNTPLAREDPDVRRLIEAMAMFTARTKLAGQRSIDQSLLRIFRQHFPYLLDPAPAMTMLRAEPTARYVDVAELPRGTEVYLIENANKKTKQRVFRFQTLSKMRILPIEIESVDLIPTRSRHHRMIIRFSTAFRRNDEIGDVDMYVNHLDDLPSSLTVLFAFKRHLKSASVVFDKEIIDEDTQGSPCQVSYGMPEGARQELERVDHPLLRARSFVHYPRQELYINVKGIRAPRNWQRFAIILDLKDTWPAELALTKDAFNLHVVPMVNLRQEMADPIEIDGTQERHPISHPDRGAQFVFQRLVAVYLMSDKGLLPLEPAIMGQSRESYDIYYDGEDDKRRASLTLNLPGAFEKKYLSDKDKDKDKDKPRLTQTYQSDKKDKEKAKYSAFRVPGAKGEEAPAKGERVAVEAFWYQPGLRGMLASDFHAKLSDRFVDGIKWAIGGPLAAPPSPSWPTTATGCSSSSRSRTSASSARPTSCASCSRRWACGASPSSSRSSCGCRT